METTSSNTKDLTTTKKLNIPSNTEKSSSSHQITSFHTISDSSSEFSSSPELEHYKPKKKTKMRHSSLDLESSPRHLSATAKLRHSISLTTTYNNEYTDDIYDFINEICEKERRSKVSVLREIIGKQLSAGSESELLPDILEDIDNRDCYGYIECKNIK